MKAFTDDTVIWFGKHKGTKLKDVPASWLLWYYEEKMSSSYTELSMKDEALLDYISDHMEQLEDEKEEE